MRPSGTYAHTRVRLHREECRFSAARYERCRASYLQSLNGTEFQIPSSRQLYEWLSNAASSLVLAGNPPRAVVTASGQLYVHSLPHTATRAPILTAFVLRRAMYRELVCQCCRRKSYHSEGNRIILKTGGWTMRSLRNSTYCLCPSGWGFGWRTVCCERI